MDLDGVWRGPNQWPGESPPLDGWVKDDAGQWFPPNQRADTPQKGPDGGGVAVKAEPLATKSESRQAQSDRRAMYTVAGIVGGACLLLAAALILITQAGAVGDGEKYSEEPEVVFAAETDQDREARKRELALHAPNLARENLAGFPEAPAFDDSNEFDSKQWLPGELGCLDTAESVLIARSSVPIVWADQLECVPDRGRWSDRYLNTVLTRTRDAAVVALVPPSVVFDSGGALWSSATRQAYVTDQEHPATLQVITADAGHNPRAQDPSAWKPSSPDIWCAYAVDWVSVKTYWQLGVTGSERAALSEMLDTCDSPTSKGADPQTIVTGQLASPGIELVVSSE